MTPIPGKSFKVIFPFTTSPPLNRSLEISKLPSRSAKSTNGENCEAAEIAHHDKEKQATLKPKKDRIIDTLTQEEYFLPKDFFKENLKELTAVIEKCENSNNKTYDKKKYAKLLEAKNRVEQEIKRAEKLINP